MGRCFQGSVACDGLLSYTFGFTADFIVPRVLLEGDVSEVQAYLLHFQRLLDGEKTLIRSDGIEERIRAETGRLVRDLDAERVKVRTLSAELETVKGVARGDEAAIIARTEATWRERLNDARAESNRLSELFRSEMEASRAELKALQERVIARDLALKSSQGRGRIGEDAFADAALRHAGWQLERSAGEARACDFVMRSGNYNVRFEIKNHNTSIPGADISKFQRDLEEHREDTGVGIFIALNVPVRAGAPLISHEWRADAGQLLVYVSAFNDNDPEFIFMVLRSLVDVYSRYKELRDNQMLARDELDCSAELESLKGRIDSAMIHIQSMARHIRELRLKLGRDKKTVVKMYDDSLEILKSITNEYSLSISVLLGTTAVTLPEDEMEESPPQVVVEQTPPAKPRAKRAPKKASQVVTENH